MDGISRFVEFGAFQWDGTEWQLGPTVTGTPFGTKEFAEWFSCENGTIRKGQSVADPVNWHSTNELVAARPDGSLSVWIVQENAFAEM